MKEINTAEAASWSDEELEYNVRYLSDRNRWAELAEIEAARAEPAAPKRTRKAAVAKEDNG